MKHNEADHGKSKWPKRLLITLLSVFCIYSIVSVFEEEYEKNHPEWNAERKEEFVRSTIASSKVLMLIDTLLSREIATCMTEKIIAKYPYSRVMQINQELQNGDSSILKDVQIITADCMGPHLNEIPRQKSVNGCVASILERKTGISESDASAYCDCFLSYINGKYGTWNPSDSIMNLELAKAKECSDSVITIAQ